MTFILISMGVFGLLGLSVLCPVLALFGYWFTRKKNEKYYLNPPASLADSQIEIIIPAHNEEKLIGKTLASIVGSLQTLESSLLITSKPQVKIHVGADGCSDKTSAVAGKFPGVSVTEIPEKRGKWSTLKALINKSNADWVILVDSGTIWSENLLSEFVLQISRTKQSVMAIAPSYRLLKAGWIHRILWRFENALKLIESYCGGPVSLHGATICYKADHLKAALLSLGDTDWINDDVVIPLTLRALYPQGVILYPVGEVRDMGVRPVQLDWARRIRMLLGNLQWVRGLLPSYTHHNPIAALVAGRRLFRVLWAYWFVLVLLGFGMMFHLVVIPVMSAFVVLMVYSASFRQICGAAIVSLMAPFLIISARKIESGVWQ